MNYSDKNTYSNRLSRYTIINIVNYFLAATIATEYDFLSGFVVYIVIKTFVFFVMDSLNLFQNN